MTRTPFDSFSKQFLETLLAALGEVTINREVAGESQYVDVYFVPTLPANVQSQDLGLLGQIATTPCLIEPFRNPATADEIRSCLLTLLSLQADGLRRSKRDSQMRPRTQLPHLWILTPSLSEVVISGFGAQPNANETLGIYPLPTALQATIVVIYQLSKTAETL